MRGPNQMARAPPASLTRLGPGMSMPCAACMALDSAASCPLKAATEVIGPVSTSLRRKGPTSKGSNPSQGVFAFNSTTHPSSLWIELHRITDLAQGFHVVQVVHHAHHVTMPRPAIAQKTKGDTALQSGGIPDRGDIALIVHPHRRIIGIEQMRTRHQHLDPT